jgi:hypothetical protein
MQAWILGPLQLEERSRHKPVGRPVGGEVTHQPEPLEPDFGHDLALITPAGH